MLPINASRPAFRWLARLVGISALVLFPWAAYLAMTLPASVSARHWPLAWAGLDVAMAAGLAVTAWLAIRRDRRLAFPAASTATLLLADAWFDVCTAPGGGPLLMALGDMCIEVLEAAGCLALALAVWRTAPPPGEPAQAGPVQSPPVQAGPVQSRPLQAGPVQAGSAQVVPAQVVPAQAQREVAR